MALLDDLLKGNVVTGLAVGIGAYLLALMVGPALRPAAKAVIKLGMQAYQGLAELGEIASDVAAEARAEEPKPVREHGPEPAKVFEDREKPGQWRVEWFDDEGHCELEIFDSHDARRQALRYAMRKYGHFREVQLEEGETPRVR